MRDRDATRTVLSEEFYWVVGEEKGERRRERGRERRGQGVQEVRTSREKWAEFSLENRLVCQGIG